MTTTFREYMADKQRHFIVSNGFTVGKRGSKEYFTIMKMNKTEKFLISDGMGISRYVKPDELISLWGSKS